MQQAILCGETETKRRNIIRVIALLPFAILLLYYAGERGILIAKATSILYTGPRDQPLPVRMVTALFSGPITITDRQFPGSAGSVRVRIFAPAKQPDAPAVVVVPGMTPYGVDDPHLMALGKRLAAFGLQVIAPDVASQRQFLMRHDAISEIDDTILWAATRQGRAVPLYGFSFSGGLVLAAASQPAYARYVSLVFCVSGYNDLPRLGDYYIRNVEVAPDGSGSKVPADDTGPLLIAMQHMDEVVPAVDVPLMQRLGVDLLSHRPDFQQKDLAPLSPEQRNLFLDVERARTENVRRSLYQLMKTHAVELESISPHTQLAGIRVPVYLLHGPIDNVTPMAEAEWNVRDMPRGVPLHYFLSSWMGHAAIGPPVPIWTRLALGNYTASVLSASGMH